MNPELDLEVEVSAGSVRVAGVHGEINARCSAGNLRIEGFESPLDLTVAAGSISATGVLDSGKSHIQCDAGRVSVRLEEGSSVRVTSQANLGKVVVTGDSESSRGARLTGSTQNTVTVGSGAGELSWADRRARPGDLLYALASGRGAQRCVHRVHPNSSNGGPP